MCALRSDNPILLFSAKPLPGEVSPMFVVYCSADAPDRTDFAGYKTAHLLPAIYALNPFLVKARDWLWRTHPILRNQA
jgi:hypothetical protein